jgi:hypothetical protein
MNRSPVETKLIYVTVTNDPVTPMCTAHYAEYFARVLRHVKYADAGGKLATFRPTHGHAGPHSSVIVSVTSLAHLDALRVALRHVRAEFEASMPIALAVVDASELL